MADLSFDWSEVLRQVKLLGARLFHLGVGPRSYFGRLVLLDNAAGPRLRPFPIRPRRYRPRTPLYATTTAIHKDAFLRSYIPYAVIAGDLSSYTPEGWNTKMSSYGYGNSYFYDVIHADAYSFSDDNNYIEVSWTPTGDSSQAFETVTQHVTENSWHLTSRRTLESVEAGELISSAWARK